jgi:hypothetical protein
VPYKVVRIDIDKDIHGWTPPPGMTDDLGQEIEQREYNQKDMDRILVINQRTRLVAKKGETITSDSGSCLKVYREGLQAARIKYLSAYIYSEAKPRSRRRTPTVSPAACDASGSRQIRPFPWSSDDSLPELWLPVDMT